MGGRGAGISKGKTGNFVRFGEYSDYSINYLALSFDENEAVTYAMEEYDMPLLVALARYVKNYSERDMFESGISAFKADENGMPVIENLQQLNSLMSRIDTKAYAISGTQKGTGTDGEPLVSKVSGKKEFTFSKEKMTSYVESIIKKNYGHSEPYTGQSKFYSTDDEVVFNGRRYSKPKWNTSTGYYAFKRKDSGLRLVGGTRSETVNVKDVAQNVKTFTAKSGRQMVNYTYNGKNMTDTLEKFNSRTEDVLISTPLRVVRKKKK